jgi:type IV fimbrial biogenesis protein FimT
MCRLQFPRVFTARLRQAGVSFIEVLAALAVLSIALGAALPSLGKALERRHLEGAAAQLSTDLRQARSLAVARRTGVRVSVQATQGESCYVVHLGADGECSCTGAGTASCTGQGTALRAVGFPAGHAVQVAANSRSMLFQPDRGTVTPTGTIRLQGHRGASIQLVVNVMGRARACSPNGTVAGLPSCT